MGAGAAARLAAWPPLLACGHFAHLGMHVPWHRRLSAALSGVWPPSRPMQRRLVAAQFVPAARSQQEAAEEEAAASSSASGSKDGAAVAGSGSGSKPASDAAAAAAAEEEVAAPAKRAAALEAALAQHCPDVSLDHMQKAALALRLFLGCRAVGEQAGDGPSMQVCAHVRRGGVVGCRWHHACTSTGTVVPAAAGPHCPPSLPPPPLHSLNRPWSARCSWTASSCLTWTPPAPTPTCGPRRCAPDAGAGDGASKGGAGG